MIRSYLIAAARNFKRNPWISFINLIGLALGLATCLVAGLYAKQELEANTFHTDLDEIHRVTVKMREYNMNGTPFAFAETIHNEFPQVKETLRMVDHETSVNVDGDVYNSAVVFADSNFFSFFDFQLKQGNEKSAFAGNRGVIISDAILKKHFKEENVIGHPIKIQLNNEWKDFAITGVVENPSTYSSLQFDFLLSINQHPEAGQQIENDWGRFFFTSFLKVDSKKLKSIQDGMPEFISRYIPDAKSPDGTISMNFVFHPFRDHHLSEGFSGGGLREGRSGKSLWVFTGIAAVILLLACFNFMNLTTAQSSKRVVEVGIRKVVGAAKSQLIPQFLFESFIICVLAAAVALGIAELSLLLFRNLLGSDLSVFSTNNTELYVGLMGVTVFTGILAGTYPALVLSNLPTLQTFKRYFKVGGSNVITRSLLSFQFCLSIVLIVCAIVMWRQQKYMMTKDLGFNKEQVLVLPFKPNDSSSLSYIKNELAKFPQVISTSRTSGAFTRGNNATLHTMPDKSRSFLYMQSIDEDYINTMQMKVVQGKSFGANGNNPSQLMVNEALLKQLNLQDSVGIRLNQSIGFVEHPTIIGVVKDFHHAQLKYEIGPLMLFHNKPLDNSYLMIRLAPNEIATGLEKVAALWQKVNPDSPFDYFFLDEDLKKQYENEQRWSKIITLATSMAIFLSILGLLGLAMFTAERRKKEVGIRKVLGASVQQLFLLLSKTYLWLILVSFLIAAPTAYYVMNKYWLEGFVYRINIDAGVYFVALVAVFSIAGIAIGSQMLRAAFQNPVDTLKEE